MPSSQMSHLKSVIGIKKKNVLNEILIGEFRILFAYLCIFFAIKVWNFLKNEKRYAT